MWSEDQPLFRVLEGLEETPLLLWSWTPGSKLPESLTALDLIRWSGPVAAQQIAGALRRLGRDFTFILGNHSDSETLEEIGDFIAAAVTIRGLRHSRVGLIPHRYLVMSNTWVDEFELMHKLGINVIYVSVNDLRESSRSVKDAEIRTYLDEMRDIRVLDEVSPRGLSEAARVSLGLAKMVEKLRLDAVSIGDCDDELHALLQCRPCLYLPSVFEMNIVVGMEGDLLGIVAQLVPSRLSGQPTMFTEIFTYDETKNEMLVGHAGMHDIRLARNRSAVTITPDYESPREKAGVWMAFSVRPGPVTLLSIASTTGGIHFVVAKGEPLPSEGRSEGYPSALVRLNTPLKSFFKVTTEVGTTQHWALVPGDLRNRLSRLASVLGLECTVIDGG
jgi:L-arabinose isomerase